MLASPSGRLTGTARLVGVVPGEDGDQHADEHVVPEGRRSGLNTKGAAMTQRPSRVLNPENHFVVVVTVYHLRVLDMGATTIIIKCL